MDRKNINKLAEKSYKVSWKADGTRYMMLIDGHNQVFFIDRDNCVYQVSNITFLHRKMPNKHLSETLLDGVNDEWRFRCFRLRHD
jgi:mRNA-capping enzyme